VCAEWDYLLPLLRLPAAPRMLRDPGKLLPVLLLPLWLGMSPR